MTQASLALVTIVAEPVLEDRIAGDLRRLGARGFTITEGRGEGSRGMRAGELPGLHVRIETVVPPERADAILAHIAERYFPHYAVIAWVSQVSVVRGEKYI